MDILGPNGVITRPTADQLARLWPTPEDAEKTARRAQTIRTVVRIVEGVLFLAAVIVVVRFVFAYLLRLS